MIRKIRVFFNLYEFSQAIFQIVEKIVFPKLSFNLFHSLMQ